MTFESEGLLIVAIYIWLPPASYVVFSDNSGYVCHFDYTAFAAIERTGSLKPVKYHTSLLDVITNVLELTVQSRPAIAVYIKIRNTKQRISYLPA